MIYLNSSKQQARRVQKEVMNMNTLEMEFSPCAMRGRKPQLFMVLDTETCTLPFADEICLTPKQKQKIAIAKPLVYDIAWQIVDRQGRVYARHSFLVTETFSVPSVFDTAYYKAKRPLYLEKLRNKEITLMDWNSIMEIFYSDLQVADYVGAFNSMFDYKKAIPFTEKYMFHLYNGDYYEWERNQRRRCEEILASGDVGKNDDWDGENFNFRGQDYPLFDLWGIACEKLINTVEYKKKCLELSMITATGQYFKSSAETTFRHICEKYDFSEAHMALDDAIIETEILQKAAKRGKLTYGLQYFPFQMLGKTTDFIFQSKKIIPHDEVQNVIDVMEEKSKEYEKSSTFLIYLERDLYKLYGYQLEKHGFANVERMLELEKNELERLIWKKKRQFMNLKEGGKAWERVKAEIQELEEQFNKM